MKNGLDAIEGEIVDAGYVRREGVYTKRDGYADEHVSNFGIQWATFQRTQFDSATGTGATKMRLLEGSGWREEDLRGALVLELGSGAGRFTEVLLGLGCLVVSVELSDACYVNFKNNENANLLLLKESLHELPFGAGWFDYVLCYGVVQHTPDPLATYRVCVDNLKAGRGRVSTDQYLKRFLPPSPFRLPKYVWRPVTSRMEPSLLLALVSRYVPVYMGLDSVLVRYLPRRLSNLIRGCIPIPCWNYTGIPGVPQDKETLVEWAIMDTFDALGARYDIPVTLSELRKLSKALPLDDIQVRLGGNGVILNGIRKA